MVFNPSCKPTVTKISHLRTVSTRLLAKLMAWLPAGFSYPRPISGGQSCGAAGLASPPRVLHPGAGSFIVADLKSHTVWNFNTCGARKMPVARPAPSRSANFKARQTRARRDAAQERGEVRGPSNQHSAASSPESDRRHRRAPNRGGAMGSGRGVAEIRAAAATQASVLARPPTAWRRSRLSMNNFAFRIASSRQ